MSKLAHSNDETMAEIEKRRAIEDGVYCSVCDGCSEKAPWCNNENCPQPDPDSHDMNTGGKS